MTLNGSQHHGFMFVMAWSHEHGEQQCPFGKKSFRGQFGIPSIIVTCCKKGLVSSPSINQPTNGKRPSMGSIMMKRYDTNKNVLIWTRKRWRETLGVGVLPHPTGLRRAPGTFSGFGLIHRTSPFSMQLLQLRSYRQWKHHGNTIWLLVSPPLKNMKVNWDDELPKPPTRY